MDLLTEQGRAWARIATGNHSGEAIELPRLGRMAFENAVASPYPQEKTIVALLDDSSILTAPQITSNVPSEVYFYIGRKRRHGHPIEEAGLTNGKLYGLTISVKGQPVTEESNDFGLGTLASGFVGEGRFGLMELGDVSGLTAGRDRRSVHQRRRCAPAAGRGRRLGPAAAGITSISSPRRASPQNCRLWHLRFDDIEQPEERR